MRQPFQVLVVPYVKDTNSFLVFHRKDFGIWQFISGGGEDNETPLQAVRREVIEETGIKKFKCLKLSSMTTIPVAYVGQIECEEAMIPEVAFAIVIDQQTADKIVLSSEHSEYKMVTYKEALAMLKYDSNKSALWEFCHRLKDTNRDKIMENIRSVVKTYTK